MKKRNYKIKIEINYQRKLFAMKGWITAKVQQYYCSLLGFFPFALRRLRESENQNIDQKFNLPNRVI